MVELRSVFLKPFAKVQYLRVPAILNTSFFQKDTKNCKKYGTSLKQLPSLKRFLFAFFFYNMGVQTVMLAAALYGKSELEIPTTNLIIAILIIQLIAIPGAYTISWLSSKIGNLKALMLVVSLWIIHLRCWLSSSCKVAFMNFMVLPLLLVL